MKSISFKKWVFWTHLTVGLLSAIFIFLMSATGVLLTYERQVKELSEMAYRVDPDSNAVRLSTDDVVATLQRLHPDEPHIFVRWVNREGAAIPAWAGMHSYLLHPYTGEVLREGEGVVGEFFHVVTDLHRYLLLEGEYKVIGKTLNGYANLVFLFLLITGVYLWVPKRIAFAHFKKVAWLPKQYLNRPHKHRQWHLVFGIWSLPALLVIASTATLFHFKWANAALYGAFGEQVPARERHPEPESLAGDLMSYEQLFGLAKTHADEHGYHNWYSMWMEIGKQTHVARFYIDKSIGHRQELAYSLYLDTRDASITRVLRKSDWSAGGQAWGTARFLHTGEYFGFVGQTVAGLVSLLACILVYSGTVLAYRRLIPLAKRR